MKRNNKKQDKWNYEEVMAELEEIIEQIESGSLPLEEVFEKFAIAVEYLRQCESFLNQGKERMGLLIETLEQDLDF
jgi:exodeoxyribonuclease VII small subunit